MSAEPRRWRVEARDGLSGLVLVALALFPPGLPGVELAELPARTGTTLWLLVALAQTLPLAMRRRCPAVTLLVVGAGFAVSQLAATEPSVAGLGLFVALYSAGRWSAGSGRVGVAAAAVTAYVGMAVWAELLGAPAGLADWVTFGLLLAAVWGVGEVVCSRSAAQDERATRAEAEALTAERARIARELHDVVTHHVTAMVVQADAGAYVGADAAQGRESFTLISTAGRAALTELRHLLHALDPGDHEGPREPLVETLAATVQRVRATGYPVTYEQDADPELADGVALALVRIVQEAITNAMRHAPAPGARVRVEHRPGRVVATVVSAAPTGAWQPGRGVANMTERAELAGGRLSVGSQGAEFVVRAELPR